MKHYHSEAIDRAVRHGDVTFHRSEFLTNLYRIRTESMKPDTIRSSFKRTGLAPFNPREVLGRLTIETSDISDTSSVDSATDAFMRTTPRKIQDFEAYANLLRQNVQDTGEETIQLVSKFTKVALELAHIGAQAMEDLASTQAAERARKLRENRSRRVVNKRDIAYINAARKRLKIRDEKEEEAYRLRKPSQRLRKIMKKWFEEAAKAANRRTILREQLKEVFADAARQARRRHILLRSRQSNSILSWLRNASLDAAAARSMQRRQAL